MLKNNIKSPEIYTHNELDLNDLEWQQFKKNLFEL